MQKEHVSNLLQVFGMAAMFVRRIFNSNQVLLKSFARVSKLTPTLAIHTQFHRLNSRKERTEQQQIRPHRKRVTAIVLITWLPSPRSLATLAGALFLWLRHFLLLPGQSILSGLASDYKTKSHSACFNCNKIIRSVKINSIFTSSNFSSRSNENVVCQKDFTVSAMACRPFPIKKHVETHKFLLCVIATYPNVA